MAIIYSYQENEELRNSDMLVGTATTLHNGKVRKITKNFTLGQLKTFINTGDLILSNGGTSGPATLIDNVLNIPVYQGQITLTTTGSTGSATLIGNTLNIPVYSGGVVYTFNAPLTETSGTVSISQANTTTNGYLSSTDWNTFYGKQNALSGTGVVKSTAGTISYINGTSAQYIAGDGSLITFPAIPSITPAALTRTNDTNVTLTLGGTPNTALLQGVSLTLGWTGTLADSRIASATTWNAKQNAITLTTTGTGAATFIGSTLNIPTPPAATFTSLTTTGSSGSSTLTAGVLNVPTYTLAGLGGVPTSRTLTINGTAYDLTADRSWSVGTITSVTATSPITSTGGTTPVISTSMATNKLIGRSTTGTGVMEEISIGSGLALSGGTLSSSALSGSILHGIAAGTDTYTVTITGATAYADGDAYLINFTNGNTTSATLNINGQGAIALWRNNDGPLIGGDIVSGGEILCVYRVATNVFQCIGTAPNTLLAYVTNAETSTITKGQAVYVSGGTGDRIKVKLASNVTDATSAQTIGIVQSTSITANQKGLIIVQGQLDNLSLFPTATWADGDFIYLGATPGTLTNVKPFAPNHLVYLGYVTTASNGSAGRMYVKVQNGYEMDELHDVYINPATLANGDLLQYNSATDLWLNKSLSAAGIQPTLPTFTSGSVIFSNGTTLAQDNANFFWDDTNNRLGINTAVPETKLQVEDVTKVLTNNVAGVAQGTLSLATTDAQTANIGPSLVFGGTYIDGDPTKIAYAAITGRKENSVNVNANGYLDFLTWRSTGLTEAMRITSNGDVGVGTQTPLLTAAGRGNITINGSSQSVLTLATGGVWKGYLYSNGTDTDLSSAADLTFGPGGGGEKARFTAAGDLGIGTSIPTTKLDVNGVITATGGNSTSWNAKVGSADNGLTLSGTVAKLGGTLLQSTTIDGGSSSAYNLTFTNGDLIISNGSGVGGLRGNIVLSNNRQIYWGTSSGNYIGADSTSGGMSYYAPPTTGKHYFYSSMNFVNYGSGTKTGTTAYNLSVTATGDIIETSPLTLTTTGTSGPATLVGATLNIPEYGGGSGGLQGIHAIIPLASGSQTLSSLQCMTGGTGQVFTANRLIAYPFIPNQSFTTSNLQLNVAVIGSGSLGRIAVYSDLNGVPDTSIFISSDLDFSTTGLKTSTTSISFVAGATYWLAFHGSAITATLNALTAAQMMPIKNINASSVANYVYRSATFTSGTPTTFGSVLYAAGNIPIVYITKA